MCASACRSLDRAEELSAAASQAAASGPQPLVPPVAQDAMHYYQGQVSGGVLRLALSQPHVSNTFHILIGGSEHAHDAGFEGREE